MALLAVCAFAQDLTQYLSDSYNGKVRVSVNEEVSPTIDAYVEITKKEGNKIDFTLKNFMLDEGMPVGNVHLTDITLEATEKDGVVSINTKQDILITAGDDEDYDEEEWWGPTLGILPIELKGVGSIDDIDIDIDLEVVALEQVIHVDFFTQETGDDPLPDDDDDFNYVPAIELKGDFDDAWVECHPWEADALVKTARGIQPSGWIVANVNGMGGMGATVVGAQGKDRTNETEGYSLVLTNTPNPYRKTQIVPGYVSIGPTWATAVASLTSVTNADGGAFGGVEFSRRPDAIRLFYKRAYNVNNGTQNKNLTERASVIAYSWKGTWTQEEVPTTTVLMGTPKKVTMTDRSNNILGKPCLTGGAITKTDDAELIASVEYYIEGDAAEWTELVVPFTYSSEAAPEKLNIILSANDLFADRTKMGTGNQLTVDDVELLYYSELQEAKYAGNDLTFTDGSCTVDSYYREDMLSLKSNGHGATVTKAYDEAAKVLKVTVKGQDFKENKDNFHVYTITFTGKKPEKGDADMNGTVAMDDAKAVADYYLGKAIAIDMEAADVDENGEIDMNDANAIVNKVIGK